MACMMRKNNTPVNTLSLKKYMSQKNNTPSRSYPFALTIAGSDSGGGAGIQADLKAFAHVGAFGLSAITAITAQNTQAVEAVFATGAIAVSAQIVALRRDFPIAAIKTGMLVDAATIACVLEATQEITAPLVVDPVMIASSGAALLDQEAQQSYLPLLARAKLITPNLDEACALLHCAPIQSRAQMRQAANALLELGCEAVLLKGGHLSGPDCPDLLLTRADPQAKWFVSKKRDIRGHGTGCTLSALITGLLARGVPLEFAVPRAISHLRAALRGASPIGAGLVCTPDPFYRRYQAAR